MSQTLIQRGSGAGGGSGAPVGDQYLVLVNDATLTGCRVFTPRDLLVATDGGANAAYSLDWTPNDTTVCWLHDDFCSGATGGNGIGELGWSNITIGGAPTVAYIAGATPNNGIVRFTTSATQGQGGCLCFNASSLGPFGNMAATGLWDMTWIFRLSGTATIRFRIGLALGATPNSVEPTDGIWLRYDTAAGFTDTNFRAICRKASTDTNVDSTVAADGNFHKIRIRSDVAGTVKFTLDGGSDLSINTNVPTVNLTPAMIIVTDTTVARSADADFFSFKMRGLVR